MTTARSGRRRADRFPGPRVVAGCFVVLTVTSGLGFYGLAVYLNAFSRERGWPVASISLATTLFFVVGGVSGLTIARIIARRDVRIVIVAGGVLGGRRLAVLGRVEERWQLYVVYAVFAARLRRRRARPGDDGRHPVVPRAAFGRPVGRLDRAVGRRHPDHARSPSG